MRFFPRLELRFLAQAVGVALRLLLRLTRLFFGAREDLVGQLAAAGNPPHRRGDGEDRDESGNYDGDGGCGHRFILTAAAAA